MSLGPMRALIRTGAIAIGGLILAVAPASVLADTPVFPPYDGDMTFAAIHDPSDPEEYSWEVQLSEGQGLEQIDEQTAEVYYQEGHLPMLAITAGPAHDAAGTAVPTSLGVSAGNIITLTVHHRAGNPAAGGAPFVYPVLGGPGWTGGFSTVIVTMPPREEFPATQREEVPESCLVPKLKGRSLRAAKKRLEKSDCELGEVTRLKGVTTKAVKVVRQSPRPNAVLAPASNIDLTLGE